MTLWTTLSARIRGASTELQELGEEEDEFTKDTSKLQALVKGMTGFDILEQDGQTFKDIYEIMIGIGEQWDKLTDIQRASLGEKLAGKRNANGFYAVMGNVERLKDIYGTAETSEGSAERAEAVFETSIQYSINKAKASLQELSYDFLDSGVLKGLIETGNAFLQILDQMIEKLGMIPTLMAAIGGARALKQTLGGKTNWIAETISKATELKTGSASSSIVKNLKDLFASSAKKANLGGEIARVTSEQLASSGRGVMSLFKGQAGKTVNISDALAKSLGMNAGNYKIGTSNQGQMTITPILREVGEAAEDASEQVEAAFSSDLNLTQASDGAIVLSQNLDNVGTAGATAGAEAAKSMSTLGSILAANPLFTGVLIAGAGIAIYKLIDYINKAGERAKAKMDNSVQEYTESNEELENLNNQLKETRDRMDELNSQKALTLVERSELDSLDQANKKLTTQIEAQKTLNKLKADQMMSDTENAFHMNYGEDILDFEKIRDTAREWVNEGQNIEQLQILGSKNLNDQLLAYQFLVDLIQQAEEAGDDISNGMSYASKALVAQNLSDQLEGIQSYIDAFEMMGVKSLTKAQKNMYDEAVEARDTIMRVINPEEWKMNKIDEILSGSKFAASRSNLTKAVQKIVDSAGENVSTEQLVQKAQDALVGEISPNLAKALLNVELTGDDLIEALVRDAIDGSATIAETIEQDLEQAAERTSSLITNIQKLRDDALNMSPAESVSYEDYQLVMDTPALYDYAEAFEVVNGVMTVNRDKWKEITEAKEESQRASLEEERAAAQAALEDQRAETKRLKLARDRFLAENAPTGRTVGTFGETAGQYEQDVADSEAEEASILRRIKGYNLLIQTLGEGADAYHTFVAAQNAAKSGEVFDSATEAFQAIYDIFDPNSDTFGMSGAGNPVYEAAIEFVIPESVREQGKEAINNYLTDMQKYLRTDAEGKFTGQMDLGKFLEDIDFYKDIITGVTKDTDIGSVVEYLLGDGSEYQELLARMMNISAEAFRAMLGEAGQYDISEIPHITDILNAKEVEEQTQSIVSNFSTIEGMLGKTLGTSDIQSIFDSDQLKQYASAIEVVNGQLQLNAEKVQEIHKAEIAKQKTENLALIQDYRNQLAQGADGAYADWLNEEITRLQLYNQTLDTATTKFTEFQLAQQMGDQGGELFKSTTEAFQAIRDVFDTTSESFGKKGLVYEAAIKLVIPDSVKTQGEQAIENYVNDMAKFWKEDAEGKLTGEMDFSKLSDELHRSLDGRLDFASIFKLNEGTLKALADDLGISFESLQSIIGELTDYGVTSFAELDALAEQMNFKQAVEDSANLASNLSTIDGILSNLMSGGTLSIDDIKSIFETDQLKRYAKALKVVNGQLSFDSEEAWKIREDQVNDQIKANEKLIDQYKSEQERMQPVYNGKDKLIYNADRITELSNRRKELTFLNQALKESTSSYNKWVEAQSAANKNQEYVTNTVDALEKINDYFQTDSGVFGQTDVALEAAIKFIVPDDLVKEDKDNVKAYLNNISDLLEKDAKGNIKGLNLKSFLNKAVEKQLVSIDNGVYKRAANKTADDWAKALGLSLGMVQAGWSQMDLFGGDINAINAADFKNWLTKFNEAYNQIDLLNGALVESVSGKGLSFSIDETGELSGNLVDIANAMKDIPGYDANKLFRLSANGVRLNNDELRKLQATQEQMIKSDFAQQIADKEAELDRARSMGYDTAPIIEELNQLKLLSSAYDGATSAYQKWLDAKSGGEVGEMYDNIRDNAISRGKELYDEGLIGTNEFRGIVNLLTYDDMYTATPQALAEAWEKANKTIEGTSYTALDFFKENEQGCSNFANALVEMTNNGIGNYAEKVGDNFTFFDTSFDELAQKLGVSTDVVTAMFDKLVAYGFDIHFFNEDQLAELNNINTDLEKVSDKLEGIKKRYSGSAIDISPVVDFNIDELNDADSLNAALKELEGLKSLNLDDETLQVVEAEIDAIRRKLGLLSETEYKPEVTIEGIHQAADLIAQIQARIAEDRVLNIPIEGDTELQHLLELLGMTPDEVISRVGVYVDGTEQLETAEETQAALLAEDGSTVTTTVTANYTQTGTIPKNETGTMTVNADASGATNAINSVKTQAEGTTADVNVGVNVDTANLDLLSQRLLLLTAGEYPVHVTAITTDADEAIKATNDAEIKEKKFFITTSNRSAMEQIKATDNKGIGEKSFRIKALDYATPVINGIQSSLSQLKDKSINITTTKTTINKTIGDHSGTALISGPNREVFHSGTAMLHGASFAHGNWGLKGNQSGALINEEKPEIIVRDGRWFIMNDGYPTFANLKKNDIIFNGDQTEQILKYGRVRGSHAQVVHADGTAHAGGSAFAEGGGGSGSFKKTTPTTTTTNNNNKNKSSGNGKSSSNNSSSDKEPTKIDWIETMLSRIQRLFDNFKNLADYYTTFKYQNDQLAKALKQARDNINKNQAAAKTYYDLAKKKSVNDEYWKKIINGELNIQEIADEKTAKAVQEAKDLYDKYLQCTDQVVELRKEILELARTKLDNIVDDFDSLNGYAESYINLLDAMITRRNTIGGQTDINKRNAQDIADLKEMAEYYNDIKSAAADYAASYKTQIENNLRDGVYVVGSQEWIDAKTQLYELQTQAYEAATHVEELNERIRELNWYSFNEGIAVIEHIDKQLGNTIDLIKDLQVYSDKSGAINENGIAQFNLYSSALANARQQVADYQVAIKALDGELASGIITQDKYNEELRDYTEKQMDAVKQVKTYRDAIIDLVKKGIQAETQAMSELISKRKEDLKKQKESNDYAKKVSDKTKEINKIKAQIAALSGDTTATTQAKIRQLQADLAKQEEELAETRMDHEYDMRTQAMDDELDRFKEIQEAKTTELETNLDAQEKAIADTLAYTSSQYQQVTDELMKLAELYGVNLENFVVNPWKDATSALEEYKNAIETLPTADVSIETDNAVHKNNHQGTNGGNKLAESGTDGTGGSSDPYGKGGDNFTIADATDVEKAKQEVASGTAGKDTANVAYHVSGKNGVWFRKDPSTYGTQIKKLENMDNVVTTGNTMKVNGVWWREVTVDGQKGWVMASYISKGASDKNTKYAVSGSNGVWFRTDPVVNETNKIEKLKNGDKVTSTGNTKTVDNKLWRQVKYGDTVGWIMDSYLKKAARGARVASGLYLTDEEGIGSEAIITKKGVLRQLDSATVFSKEQTDRLWKLSKSDLLENIKPSAFAGGISLSYGSLLTVNGNVDRDALPGLQDLLKQACEYTKRDLKQNLMKMGMR